MTSRWVVVDDTDSAITYTGSWFADQGSLDNIGNFGAPYLSTSHGINSTGSFSYIFTGMRLCLFIAGGNVFDACVETGSRVLITGSSGPDTPTSVSWECVVDNGSPSNISVSGAENNLRLCEQDGLSDAPHVLTVNVQATNGATFWLDYVKYLPSASTPGLENAAISIDSTDPDLNFQGWTQFSPGFETSATGSKLSFNFIGNNFFTQWYYIILTHISYRKIPSLLWFFRSLASHRHKRQNGQLFDRRPNPRYLRCFARRRSSHFESHWRAIQRPSI